MKAKDNSTESFYANTFFSIQTQLNNRYVVQIEYVVLELSW